MADQTPEEKAAADKAAADKAAADKARRESAITRVNPDDPKSEPVRDFTDHASAVAQAKAIGGTVEHVGVAFHVADR